MSFEKNRREITQLLNERYTNGIGCEIGVLRGDFSEHLLTNWKCKTLYLVDCWTEHSDYDETFHNHENNYTIMKKKLEPFKERINICRGYSHQVVNHFGDNFFDFIYIDANHSYEGCKKDLDLYWSKLKDGGIIMGDDYHLSDVEHLNFDGNQVTFGVTKAVKEFVREKNRIYDISYTADWRYSNPEICARNFVIQK
jgi:hypothetical protein